MDKLTCPPLADFERALLLLQRRGRAWQNAPHEVTDDTVLRRFWRAVGAALKAANDRLCALRAEFFCGSAAETLDWWRADYGLPDPCDPFADVCAKVRAVGDTTPAYATAAALPLGWVITISEEFIFAPQDSLVDHGFADALICDALQGVVWRVAVDSASPAYVGFGSSIPYADNLYADRLLACDPDLSALECLLRRIAPAHVDLVFSIT